jgi:peptidyl-prolyl cis-trans isomerase C
VVARVNGRPISLRSVIAVAERAVTEGEDRRVAYRRAADHAVVRELLLQEALARGLQADDRAVQRAYDEARVNYKDDKAWAELLAGAGLDPHTYNAELRIKFTVEALRAQEADKAPAVTDQEARAHYDAQPEAYETGERLVASHILIGVPPGTSPTRKAELRSKAADLLARLRRGADFEALARDHSQDPDSAARGGRLPEFGRGQTSPPFEKAAMALAAGQLSDVVETPAGFHLIKLHERLPSRRPSFEEVAEFVKRRLTAERRQAAVDALVAALRRKAKVETFL